MSINGTKTDEIILQTVLNNVSDGIIIIDFNGVVIYANQTLSSITGYPNDEIVGKKADEFYPEEWQKIKMLKETVLFQLKNKKKSGVEYSAELKVMPIFDNPQNISHFVCILHDTSKLEEGSKMNEFVSFASHQMRTPLQAIKWFIEYFQARESENLTNSQRELLNDISQSNDRLINLVDVLLDVNNIENGIIQISPHKARAKDILDEVVKTLEMQAFKKRLTTKQLVRDTDVITVDEKMIKEALSNIYANAIKYTPDGGEIIIEVSKNEKSVQFSVTDTGFGIPADEQNKIFRKFFRASNSKKQYSEGSGIGLYLSKLIVEASGGEIGFSSIENKGTTFWFRLPQL